MGKYMFSLYEAADWMDQASEQEWQDAMRAHEQFAAAVKAAGAEVVSGEGLAKITTATTVADGVVKDGPYLPSSDVLGGFYVIECADLDAALALAKVCPAPAVEIRPVLGN